MKIRLYLVLGLAMGAVTASGLAAESDAMEASRRNLKAIWGAYRSYEMLHAGKAPTRLGDLLSEDLVSGPQVFNNPAAGSPVPKRAEIDEQGDYTLAPTVSAPDALVREKRPTHTPGKVLAGFKDGTIKLVDAPAEVAAVAAPMPPAPAVTTPPAQAPAAAPTPVTAAPASITTTAPAPVAAPTPTTVTTVTKPGGPTITFTPAGTNGLPADQASVTISLGGIGALLGGGDQNRTAANSAPVAGASLASASLPGAAAITEFQLLDATQDRVGGHGHGAPDGQPDGRFRLGLALPAGSEVLGIKLSSADAAGNPGQHVWNSRPVGNWMVGVFRDGIQLNPTHAPTLGKMEGALALELFMADVGVFKPGENFLVEVTLGNGTVLRSQPRAASAPAASPAITVNATAAPGGAGGGKPVARALPSAPAITEFRLLDATQDRVGGHGHGAPDGQPDGRFSLGLALPAGSELLGVKLSSADAAGNPGQHVWNSRPAGNWMIGVFRDGAQLNPTHATTLGAMEGAVALELFMADVGVFKPGENFLVEVTLGNGTVLRSQPRAASSAPSPIPGASGAQAGGAPAAGAQVAGAFDEQLRQAAYLVNQRRPAEALAIYDRILEADAKNAPALVGAGACAVALGDNARAAGYYRRLMNAGR